ncbi:MAG: DUF2889 domain-containing protein [Chloroflexi bacterium]|nr:DUF2889 domain-containing protein [Chloroflexota bacterium]
MEQKQRKLIHTRVITVHAYDEGDGAITLEGKLEDTQPLDSGYFKMVRPHDTRAPGVIHTMAARLKVDIATTQITHVESRSVDFPYTSCPAILPNLQALIGVSVTKGFNRTFREKVGGPLGCAHMNTLIQTMAVARHTATGYFATPPPQPGEAVDPSKPTSESYRRPPVDSCHLWRKDGPLTTARDEGKSYMAMDF